MTRDEIINLAREADMDVDHNAWGAVITAEPADLERFAYLVAAKEREACARVCEENADCCNRGSPLYTILSSNATAIRARGNT